MKHVFISICLTAFVGALAVNAFVTAQAPLGINGYPGSFDNGGRGGPPAFGRVLKFLHRTFCAGLPEPNITNTFSNIVSSTSPVAVQPAVAMQPAWQQRPVQNQQQQQQRQPSNGNGQQYANALYRAFDVNRSTGQKRTSILRQNPPNVTDLIAQESTLIRTLSSAARNVWFGNNNADDTARCAALTDAEEKLFKFRLANNLPLGDEFQMDFPPPPPPPSGVSQPGWEGPQNGGGNGAWAGVAASSSGSNGNGGNWMTGATNGNAGNFQSGTFTNGGFPSNQPAFNPANGNGNAMMRPQVMPQPQPQQQSNRRPTSQW